MFLASFERNNNIAVGMVNKGKSVVKTVESILGSNRYPTMNQLIESISPEDYSLLKAFFEQDDFSGENFKLSEVNLLAPIPNPNHDIICVGLNYKDHVKEFDNRDIPEHPVIFSKRSAITTGHNGGINGNLAVDNSLDYEVELAVIMSKDCYKAPESEVEAYIFGYTILNDFSARSTQARHQQWYLGKSPDGFSAFGPWIITKDMLPINIGLDLCSRVNGELRQSSNTSYFIFSIPKLISTISQSITLKAGDIIATGTPAGVGKGFNPPRYLKSGDIVECEIEKIGILSNRII